METFIEIIKQIGVAVATIFLACPIFILFFIEYIERWDKKKQNNKNEIEKIQKEREERQQRIDEIRRKRLAIEEEIARIDSFTRSIKGATNHDYIKEQQKIHFPDKFN
jgi:hypothetical protein